MQVQSYIKNIEYAQSLSNYLQNQDWKRFCTFTTTYELTLNSARRLNERFYDRVKHQVFDNLPVRLFWVAEKFESKDGYHTHGLLDYPQSYEDALDLLPVLKLSYEIVAQEKPTKFDILYGDEHKYKPRASFLRYDAKKAGALYCTKYLLKSCADYDFLC